MKATTYKFLTLIYISVFWGIFIVFGLGNFTPVYAQDSRIQNNPAYGYQYAQKNVPMVAFFTALPDVPITSGLREDETLSVTFDKPQGRFVEVFAVGKVPAPTIDAYYEAVLPQMGWAQQNARRFVRGAERLDLSVDKQGTQTILKISVSPV